MVWAAILGLVGFGWLVLFQLALAAGLPIGNLAWGGQNKVLSSSMRVASLGSALLAGFGCTLMAQSLGYVDVLPGWLVKPSLIGLAALFALSLVGNAMSSSRIERLHGVPLTLVLSITSGLTAFTLV